MNTKICFEILLRIAKYLREQELDNRTIIKKDVLLQNFRLTNGKMVVTGKLDWGGAMLCLLRCPAGEDDIDIGGCVLEVLTAQVGVGRLLLHGGDVVLALLPP